MLVTEGSGIPIGLLIESATPHEVKLAQATLATVRVAQRRGRPRTRPKELVADKAYDSRALRIWLRSRGIKPTIPRFERRQRKKPKRGRPFFAPVGAGYKNRWKIERTFARLQNFRRLLVRHEHHVQVFRGFCFIACLLMALRHFSNYFYTWDGRCPVRPVNDAAVAYPSFTVLFCDAFDRTVGTRTPRGYWIDAGYEKGRQFGLSDRHSEGSNATFLDGHAKWYKTNSLLNQKAIDTSANTYIEMTNYNKAGVIWDVDAANPMTAPNKYPSDYCRN